MFLLFLPVSVSITLYYLSVCEISSRCLSDCRWSSELIGSCLEDRSLRAACSQFLWALLCQTASVFDCMLDVF